MALGVIPAGAILGLERYREATVFPHSLVP
jgi:hypothetical protein